VLEEFFSEKRGTKVRLVQPQKGTKFALQKMAEKTAQALLERAELAERGQMEVLDALQKYLKLKQLPLRLECFDISNHQGANNVGAMACFINLKPAKKEYRKFKIKTVKGQDDFASIMEVVFRYYRKHPLPDLIVIDGGKAQLNSAKFVLDDMGFLNYNIVALAKSRDKITTEGDTFKTEERLYFPGKEEPLILDLTKPESQVLIKLRDETHRSAVTFHRQRQKSGTLKSSLDEIQGLGPKRRTALFRKFGSVAKIRNASLKALIACGLPEKIAKLVLEKLKK
jgi:excinuclease ABC subunit C